jgi:hypothetical protein
VNAPGAVGRSRLVRGRAPREKTRSKSRSRSRSRPGTPPRTPRAGSRRRMSEKG